MANLIKHRFVSAKTDGSDATQVQPSHWNDGHAFVGGAAGDVLVRDPTDATWGARWGNAITVVSLDGSVPTVPLPAGHAPFIDIDCANAADMTIHGIEVRPETGFGTRATIRARSTGNVLLPFGSPSAPANGQLINLFVSGPTPLSAGHLLDGSHGGGNGGSAQYVFDGARWRLVAHEQGRPIKIPFNAANYGGMTVSVAPSIHDYYIHGTDAHCRVSVAGSVPTPAGTITVAGWPFTFAPPQGGLVPAATSIGAYGLAWARQNSDLATIRVDQLTFGAWPVGNLEVLFDGHWPIR